MMKLLNTYWLRPMVVETHKAPVKLVSEIAGRSSPTITFSTCDSFWWMAEKLAPRSAPHSSAALAGLEGEGFGIDGPRVGKSIGGKWGDRSGGCRLSVSASHPVPRFERSHPFGAIVRTGETRPAAATTAV